ncbi:histone-lysine N-methyltransferase SETMAR [Trichonephila clavipes]|nr:histone-lysine N-methyltransferase SETMAR [Trichonephila clavipes]
MLQHRCEGVLAWGCKLASELGNLALDDVALQAAIEKDSSQTCGELARQFNTSSETARLHLHRLGKTYRLSKWVPHTLLEVHKHQRVAACLSLLSRHRSASIFNRVLTSDEKWVLYHTPKRSKYWLSPQDTVPHRERPSMHPRKIMLCVWWTCRQVVHYELLPMGQTVTANLYLQQMERVQQALHQKKPALVNRKVYCYCMIKRGHYHLFHSLDNHLRGKSFTKNSDVRQALTDFFASHTPKFYRKGNEQLETRWQKMLDVDGDYFED